MKGTCFTQHIYLVTREEEEEESVSVGDLVGNSFTEAGVWLLGFVHIVNISGRLWCYHGSQALGF